VLSKFRAAVTRGCINTIYDVEHFTCLCVEQACCRSTELLKLAVESTLNSTCAHACPMQLMTANKFENSCLPCSLLKLVVVTADDD
jgi:hypothetical protein